jgi:hypothetical protein
VAAIKYFSRPSSLSMPLLSRMSAKVGFLYCIFDLAGIKPIDFDWSF